MGPFELAIIGLGAMVGTLTLIESPPDVMVDDISAPKELEERGYTGEVLAELLDDAGLAIYLESNQPDFSLRLNYDASGISELSKALGLRETVKAMHGMLGMVDQRVHLSFVTNPEENTLMAILDIMKPGSGQVLHSERISGSLDDVDGIIDQVADILVEEVTPYPYAVHLFNSRHNSDVSLLSLSDPSKKTSGDYSSVRTYIEEWLVRYEIGFVETEEQEAVYYHWASADTSDLVPRRIKNQIAPMFNLLGVVSLAEGDLKYANQSFLKAISLDDSRADPYINIGRILQLQGEPEMALGYLSHADKIKPRKAITKVYSALANLQLDRKEEALADLKEAISRQPALAVSHELYAEALRQTGGKAKYIAHSERQARLNRWRFPQQYHALPL